MEETAIVIKETPEEVREKKAEVRRAIQICGAILMALGLFLICQYIAKDNIYFATTIMGFGALLVWLTNRPKNKVN